MKLLRLKKENLVKMNKLDNQKANIKVFFNSLVELEAGKQLILRDEQAKADVPAPVEHKIDATRVVTSSADAIQPEEIKAGEVSS